MYSAVRFACSSSVSGAVDGGGPRRTISSQLGSSAAPVEHHVADVELVRLRRRLHVVGAAAGRVGVDGDDERAVGLGHEVVAVEQALGAHAVVPEREVVLGHPVRADAAADLVALVARDRDDPVDRVGVVDAPPGARDAQAVDLVLEAGDAGDLRVVRDPGSTTRSRPRTSPPRRPSRSSPASTGDGCSFSSQSARTTSRASATTGCSQSRSAAFSCSCCSAVATGCSCIAGSLALRESAPCSRRTARGSARR